MTTLARDRGSQSHPFGRPNQRRIDWMAPPVVIYVGVSLAVCGVLYAVHEVSYISSISKLWS